jgi:uncharacterized membrane protein
MHQPVHVMNDYRPRSLASVVGHPIHVMLVPFPIACFVGALVTDIVYWQSTNMMWADFSAWLLAVGVVIAVLAAIAGLIDFIGSRQIRNFRAAWIHAIGNVTVIVLAIFNSFVHSRDAYTSVVPAGLILSAITVLILLVTGWNGWTMVYRHGVAVMPEAKP